jgi:hypothetical protein
MNERDCGTLQRELIAIEQSLGDSLEQARKLLIGKEASLTKGCHRTEAVDRLGRITDVMANSGGTLLCCFYVYKIGTTEFLNSKSWTRQYRPLSHLDILQ